MEVSQLWSVLYFFMLLMLGMGSMLGNTAAILTPLTDSKAISRHLPKEAISGERRAGRRRDSGRADGGDQRPHRSPAFTFSSPWAVGTWHVSITPCVWLSTPGGREVATPTWGKGQVPQPGTQSSQERRRFVLV